MDEAILTAQAEFRRAFGTDATVLSHAGGRVNLIGEHTDYHEGFVFPAAIDLRTWALGAPRADGLLRIRSTTVNDEITVAIKDIAPQNTVDWKSYVLGPFWVLRRKEYELVGADILIAGDVPFGGGLSSSASVEVALVGLGAKLAGRCVEPMDAARLARMAENEFCHVPCGAMDQVASACGLAGHMLLLDCRTMEITPVAFPSEWALIVADSGVKHALGTSEYARRQVECAMGIAVIAQSFSEARVARDVRMDMLAATKYKLSDIVYRRLHHVVTENARVHHAKDALNKGDGERLGQLLFESHASLAQDYQVSCEELDTLVDVAKGVPGVLGARLTGAGFGGNTVNLVVASQAEEACAGIVDGYAARTGRCTKARVVHPSSGLTIATL